MKFTALLVAAASAIAAQARALDVWAPPFTFPTAGVVLVCGQEYTFTWYGFSLTMCIVLGLTKLGTCLRHPPKSRTRTLKSISVRTARPFQVRRSVAFDFVCPVERFARQHPSLATCPSSKDPPKLRFLLSTTECTKLFVSVSFPTSCQSFQN